MASFNLLLIFGKIAIAGIPKLSISFASLTIESMECLFIPGIDSIKVFSFLPSVTNNG